MRQNQCQRPTQLVRLLSYGNTDNDSTSLTGVRKTQTSGIGIRWINSNTHSGKSQTFSTTRLNNGGTNLRGMPLNGTVTITDTFELVKTGPVTSGRLNPESYAVNYKNKKGSDHGRPLYTYSFKQPAIKVIGCSFKNASQTVPCLMSVRATSPASAAPAISRSTSTWTARPAPASAPS